jgi:signal transduction histidine kinase
MNDSMQKITARMREFATSVLEAKNIEVEFSIEEPVYDIKLHMEARRDLFLVYKEAINNAAKYSKAGKVTVTLTTQPNRLHLEVRDNGVGFNVTTADSGNGLGNMQKRAESMNGKLQLISSPGTGTRVLLTIPLQ